MKRIFLVFMVIGLVTMISATQPKYSSDGNINPSNNLEQQKNYSPQAKFFLKLINKGSVKFDILLANTITQRTYGSYTVNGGSIQDSIPVGIYDIQVTPETMPANFFATVLPGCSTLYEGYVGSTATIYCYNITLNSNLDCSNAIVTDIEWVGHY